MEYKLISKATGETIGTIVADHGVSELEAIRILGGEFEQYAEDENVTIDGKRYYFDDLETVEIA